MFKIEDFNLYALFYVIYVLKILHCKLFLTKIDVSVPSHLISKLRETKPMKHLTATISFIFVIALAGCTSAPPLTHSNLSATQQIDALRLAPNGPCPVWIYRNKTLFHALNPEQPYVFVNDLKIDTLSIGQTYCLNLAPGRYQIAIKEPILFMPAFTAGSVVVEISEGSTQYLRYSKEFGGIIPTGAGVGVTSNKKLEIVSKQAWEGRL
jgi:hypothetical protein